MARYRWSHCWRNRAGPQPVRRARHRKPAPCAAPELRTAASRRAGGHGLAPSTVARWRTTLLAALSYGAEEFGVTGRRFRRCAASMSTHRLPDATTGARLLASYSQWAAPVMLVLCETGLRTQEALRLDWRHIDWQHGVIVVEHSGRHDGPRTKTGKSRRVGMRPAVRNSLLAIWEKRDRPDKVALCSSASAASPTLIPDRQGAIHSTKAHRTACRKAGIDGFRIHDWRHHFAVWFLKRSGNLRALCQIAGWSSIRMVQRYAVFEQSDLDEIMSRTARRRATRDLTKTGQNGHPGCDGREKLQGVGSSSRQQAASLPRLGSRVRIPSPAPDSQRVSDTRGFGSNTQLARTEVSGEIGRAATRPISLAISSSAFRALTRRSGATWIYLPVVWLFGIR